MIKIFGFAILFSIGGILAEKALYAKIPSLSEPSSCFPSLPRSFGIFVAVITAFNFWTVTYGMTVGLARKKYKEMAEKNGEKDTEMRYNLPNLYVDGNTNGESHSIQCFSSVIFLKLSSDRCFPHGVASNQSKGMV
jgi:hypothetical protein